MSGLPLLNSVSKLGLDKASMDKLERMPREAQELLESGALTMEDRHALLAKVEEKLRWNGSQKRSAVRTRQKELLDELQQVLAEARDTPDARLSEGMSAHLAPHASSPQYVGGLTD